MENHLNCGNRQIASLRVSSFAVQYGIGYIYDKNKKNQCYNNNNNNKKLGSRIGGRRKDDAFRDDSADGVLRHIILYLGSGRRV